MLPELARRALEAYSDPGDLIVDPMCGIGTTLVEAIHADRCAIGIEVEERWATLARSNLTLAASQGATGKGGVVTGDARDLPRLLRRQRAILDEKVDDGVAQLPSGAADLVLISPPYACSVGVPTKRRVGPLCIKDTLNYGPDRTNVGHARGRQYGDAMIDIYRAAAAVLKPGGFLVAVTKGMRQKGRLHDLASQTIGLCQGVGLDYWQHAIALHATLHDDDYVPRCSFWQLLQARRAVERGERAHIVCHEDVVVFRKQEARR